MDDAKEDTNTTFMRRIAVKGRVKAGDFKIGIEKDNTPEAESCDAFCALREISINDADNYSEEDIIESYKESIMRNKVNIFSPQLKLNYCKFKLVTESGHVKYSPQNGGDSHFDLFKKDTFDVTQLIINNIVFIDFPNTQLQTRPEAE